MFVIRYYIFFFILHNFLSLYTYFLLREKHTKVPKKYKFIINSVFGCNFYSPKTKTIRMKPIFSFHAMCGKCFWLNLNKFFSFSFCVSCEIATKAINYAEDPKRENRKERNVWKASASYYVDQSSPKSIGLAQFE